MKKTLAALLCGALLTGLLSFSALAAGLTDGATNFTLSAPTAGTTTFTQTAYVVDANGRYVTDANGKFLTEQVTKTAYVVPEGTVVTADGALLADLYYHLADGDYWDVHPLTDILSGASSVTVNCAARLAALQADGLNADRVIYRIRGTQRTGATVRGVGTGIYLTCADDSAPEEPDTPQAPTFPDVSVGDWFHPGVTAAAQAGLIAGSDTGKFDPEAALTWAQAVTFAVRTAQYSAGEAVYGPADQTGEHWYDVYADYALTRGILAAAPADWEAVITRAEATVLFAALLGEPDPGSLPASTFSDLEPGSDVMNAALAMANAGMCNGTGGGKFSPDRPLHRHETAVLMARLTGLIAPVTAG